MSHALLRRTAVVRSCARDETAHPLLLPTNRAKCPSLNVRRKSTKPALLTHRRRPLWSSRVPSHPPRCKERLPRRHCDETRFELPVVFPASWLLWDFNMGVQPNYPDASMNQRPHRQTGSDYKSGRQAPPLTPDLGLSNVRRALETR
jgi:hypothetical protein